MKLNENLKTLHVLFKKYAPAGSALLDVVVKNDEFIILYRDDKDRNIIGRLSSNGLCGGHYYANYLAAWIDFSDIK